MKPKLHKNNPLAEFLTAEGCFILEHINTPEDPNVSLARARVPPGANTVLHRLDGITERYHVLTGCGSVRLGSQAAIEVVEGDSVTIPAGVAQQIHNIGDDDLVFLCICTPRFVPERYVDLETARTPQDD